MHLPVIIGLGGVNPGGRISAHASYYRTVYSALSAQQQLDTIADLAALTNHSVPTTEAGVQALLAGSLIREIIPETFDAHHVAFNQRMRIPLAQPLTFTCLAKDLPHTIPQGWQVDTLGNQAEVTITGVLESLIPTSIPSTILSAGQLPTGFDPQTLYNARNHPRGLQLAIFAANDALNAMGIEWKHFKNSLQPNRIGVYAGSGLGQLDELSLTGLLTAHANGLRIKPKLLPMSYPQMAADFINAYILGSIGPTGSSQGACATFLYNLERAVEKIKHGQLDVAVVATSEAPITPELLGGFDVMGALADPERLRVMDNAKEVDLRNTLRPFGNNCGFTIGEAAQCVVLCRDDIAIACGAKIYGSVPHVYCAADGGKKSITSPGAGNYLTVAQASAALLSIVGKDQIARTFIHSHGTGTPQNRETESHILNSVAKSFAVQWPVVAIKSQLGHSQAAAGGDQVSNALGIWEGNVLPGITSTPKLAEDVHSSNLEFVLQHQQHLQNAFLASLINAKGFGGNNATAVLLSPAQTHKILGKSCIKPSHYQRQVETTESNIAAYTKQFRQGNMSIRYAFGENVLEKDDVSITTTTIKFSDYPAVALQPSEFAK